MPNEMLKRIKRPYDDTSELKISCDRDEYTRELNFACFKIRHFESSF